MDVLTLEHVSKSFGGRPVLDDLCFSVPQHCIYGFIGENGAGKTTTMKLILGLLRSDSGLIRVLGEPVCFGSSRTNRSVGYLPDVPEFYDFLTPKEYLELCGRISGLTKSQRQERIQKLLKLVGLDGAEKRIHGFSRGMKQRLGIAQALLGEPQLLICDEPTSALDPVGRREILDILADVRSQTTVLFSTHILSDVERICDRIAVLRHGSIALEGSLDEVGRLHRCKGLEIEFIHEADSLLFAEKHPASRPIGRQKVIFDAAGSADMTALMGALAVSGVDVQRIELLEPTLEDLFLEVMEK